MTKILATLVLASAFSTAAFAEKQPVGGCAGKLIGDCQEYDQGSNVGPNYITCIARDSANVKYTYTGSYGKPTSVNVAGAVKQCKAESEDPASCHWTACVWAD